MKRRKLFLMLLAFILVLAMTGCGGQQAQTSSPTADSETDDSSSVSTDDGEVTTITYLTLGDQGTGLEAWYRMLVDEFNTANEGKYYLDVEWMQGNDPEMQSKLRMLNAADDLPNIFNVGGDVSFYEVLKKNNRLVDLKPYIDADSEWEARLISDCVESFTEDNGGIYMVPEAAMCPVGVFWNEALFAQAGLDHFPTTWEEFWETCDTLQEAGITPLALQTSAGAWTSIVMSTAYMGGSSQGGFDFISTRFPETYDVPVMRDMMEFYVKMFDYANPDSIGGDYALAANHFTNEEAAMMLNGPWMMETLRDTNYSNEGLEERVGFAPFPNDTVVFSFNQVGFVLSADATDAQIEAAVEYMKTLSTPEHLVKYFEMTGGYSPSITLDEETYDELMPPMQDYADMFANDLTVVPNYQTQWNSIIINEVFTTDLPALVQGSMSIDEYIAAMDDAVEQFNEQNEE